MLLRLLAELANQLRVFFRDRRFWLASPLLLSFAGHR
jgi:hypothetical protein